MKKPYYPYRKKYNKSKNEGVTPEELESIDNALKDVEKGNVTIYISKGEWMKKMDEMYKNAKGWQPLF